MKKYNDLSELDQYKIKNHIANLFALSSIDGKFSKSEAETILRICDRYGIVRQDISEMKKDGVTFEYSIPSDTYEKLEQIYDFVTLILADGTIDTKELDLCRELTKILQIDQKNINNLMMTMIENIQKDRSFEEVRMNLYAIVHH